MRQSIRGYTDGVIEDAQAAGGEELANAASQLAAARDLILGSGDLSGALSDPGIPAASRRNLVSDLFSTRLGRPAVRLLTFAVDADRASEVAEDLVWLAVRLDAAAKNLVSIGETVLGHKAAEERLDGYATAVLEQVDGDRELVAAEDELFRFHRTLQGSEELTAALSSRDIPADARRRVVVELLQPRSAPATVRLASYATQVGRPRDYEELVAFLVDRVAAEGDRRVAEVRSAVELDEPQRSRLARALGHVIGRQVDVRVTIDPTVVGGFVATIGDTVVDGSSRRRLELLKERLVTQEAITTTSSAGSTGIATTGEPTDG